MAKVYRGMMFNDECRFYISDMTELVEEINQKTIYSPTAIAALGRSTMISSILGLMEKDGAKVSTIINGNGPIGSIIVTANSEGKVKSKVSNPLANVEKISDTKLDVGSAVGVDGTLRVIKDLNLKDPFVTEVPLQNGEIGLDYAYYFTSSEQIPTAVSVGVLINKDHSIQNASVFIAQLLPNASEECINNLENYFSKGEYISSALSEKTVEEFLESNFKNEYKVLEEKEVVYECDCSEDKFVSAIRLLPAKDIIDIKKDDEINCKCDFCYKEYDIKTDKI